MKEIKTKQNSRFENLSVEITQMKSREKRNWQNYRQSTKWALETFKWPNICVIRFLTGEEREQRTEKNIWRDNDHIFSRLDKNCKALVARSWMKLILRNINKTTLRHIIIKLLTIRKLKPRAFVKFLLHCIASLQWVHSQWVRNRSGWKQKEKYYRGMSTEMLI